MISSLDTLDGTWADSPRNGARCDQPIGEREGIVEGLALKRIPKTDEQSPPASGGYQGGWAKEALEADC
ncbi:MAG TPA: hypothetical protein PKD73_15710 [Burkholderiaceae bacterium]|nr:hypothetical protein [Burkholderiaceae bacterium]